MLIKFAILAAVSTPNQAAEDKLSIPDQLAKCRAFIAANGGVEVGVYILDGYSRTGYDSLEVAMAEIPPLAAAINAAAQNKYDILLMDNFDRLGDLGFIVKTRFKKLRKQLHSVRQSGKLTPPNLYDPYADDSADIQMHVEGIIQTYRINKIRRGWNIGVPDRARTGLHPLSIPYAYKLSAKNEPAVQIPAEAALVIQMKDLFLAGKTLQQICDHANAVSPPRRARAWSRTVVKRILQNRFYAGITTYGKLKTLEGKRIPQPRSQWIVGLGKHSPLWDEATHTAILLEIERRGALRTRASVYAISGLLVCATCGQRLYRHGKLESPFEIYLSCHTTTHCISIKYNLAHQLIAQKIVHELRAHRQSPVSTRSVQSPDPLALQLSQLSDRRRKVQEGYEANLYTAAEAAARIVAIETELDRLTAQQERAALRTQQQKALLQFAEQDLEHMQQWILMDDPTTVNHLLTALCEKITITPAHQLTITWR